MTKSHSFVEPSISAALSSEEFMSFFTNEINNIRENTDQGLSTTADVLPLLITLSSPDAPLDRKSLFLDINI